MEILVPLTFFAMIAAIVLVPTWLKSREKREMQETVRHAVDKGQPLPVELVEAIAKSSAKPPVTAAKDRRVGVLLLAFAGGIFATFYMMGQQFDEDVAGVAAFAAIPGFIGLAYVILSFFNKTKAV